MGDPLWRIVLLLCAYLCSAAVVPDPLSDSGSLSARAALSTRGREDERQARVSVRTTQVEQDKRHVRVTFTGFFNVTATVALLPNETESAVRAAPWALSAALNFSAVRGPVAITFGAASAHASADLRAGSDHTRSADGAALGGAIRVADKGVVGFGVGASSAAGGASAQGKGGASSGAQGGGAAHVEAKAGSGSSANATGIALGDGGDDGVAHTATYVNGSTAAGAVGTVGMAYIGNTTAVGVRNGESVGAHAYGEGHGKQADGGGGGSGVAAGYGANATASHSSNG